MSARWNSSLFSLSCPQTSYQMRVIISQAFLSLNWVAASNLPLLQLLQNSQTFLCYTEYNSPEKKCWVTVLLSPHWSPHLFWCLSTLSPLLATSVQFVKDCTDLMFLTLQSLLQTSKVMLSWWRPHQFSLPPHFQNFLVGIGVLVGNVSRARSRPILWQKSAGFVAHPASVAQSFGSHGSYSPLRCFLSLAVLAL